MRFRSKATFRSIVGKCSGVSLEIFVYSDPSAMNGAENSKNEAQTSNYQQVLNGVKSETPAEGGSIVSINTNVFY